ncbi:MAG TPA: secretin and TonB N-terminal domain-containing protein [bacterium]|nr:secretin and TonB N-terminal domain-containing protein [bacterium]
MKKTMVWIRGILIFGLLFLSVAAGTAGADQVTPGEGKLAARRIVRLELRNAELADVLRLFSKEYALNIVAGRDISGTVTISLNQVDAADALRTILVANGYDYEQVGDIYMVTTRENILARRKNLLEGEALETRIFWLNYLGAQDLARVIEKELSPRGNLRFLSQTILNGWEMGGVSGSETSGELGRKIRLKKEQDEKAPVLVVSDIPAVLNRIGALIRELDVKPEQVLIEAVIVEVNSEMVRDLGIEWKYTHTDGDITSGFIPGTVTPPAPGFTGLEVAYDRAVGENPLMVTLRALEEKKKANISPGPGSWPCTTRRPPSWSGNATRSWNRPSPGLHPTSTLPRA